MGREGGVGGGHLSSRRLGGHVPEMIYIQICYRYRSGIEQGGVRGG